MVLLAYAVAAAPLLLRHDTAQCEAMVSDFDGAISTLDLNEDLLEIFLNQFSGCNKLPSQFHEGGRRRCGERSVSQINLRD